MAIQISRKALNLFNKLCSIQFRFISLDKLSNKRITRLESDLDLGHRLINRNPRNLEQLSFEYKPKGFWLDNSAPSNWNTLVFDQRGRNLNAFLVHWSGKILIEASTRESQLTKYFKSPNSAQAASILAQVISRRCLQSGYLYAGIPNHEDSTGLKTKVFYDAVEKSGFVLQEPPEIVPRSRSDL